MVPPLSIPNPCPISVHPPLWYHLEVLGASPSAAYAVSYRKALYSCATYPDFPAAVSAPLLSRPPSCVSEPATFLSIVATARTGDTPRTRVRSVPLVDAIRPPFHRSSLMLTFLVVSSSASHFLPPGISPAVHIGEAPVEMSPSPSHSPTLLSSAFPFPLFCHPSLIPSVFHLSPWCPNESTPIGLSFYSTFKCTGDTY